MSRTLRSRSMKSRMLLSVHDEIVFEVPQEELAMMQTLAPEVMEGVWELKVPLKVNTAWGANWAEAH
jgi:DNA polymerase I